RDCTVTTTGDCATVLRSRSWAYDGDSQPTLTTSPEGRTTASTYDTAGQLASTTQRTNPADPATAVTVQLGYDALGDRTRMVDGNGNATTYTYNVWGQPESTVGPPTTAHPATHGR